MRQDRLQRKFIKKGRWVLYGLVALWASFAVSNYLEKGNRPVMYVSPADGKCLGGKKHGGAGKDVPCAFFDNLIYGQDYVKQPGDPERATANIIMRNINPAF